MSDLARRLLAVLVDLTVIGPSGGRDLRVETRPGVLVSAVLATLARAVGAGPGQPAWCSGRRLDPPAPWADCGVRDGAVIRFGAVAEEPSNGTVTVQVVGGPEAGRDIVLGRGNYTIGRDDGSDVTLHDDEVSRAHAVLSVSRDGVHVHDLGSTNGTTVDGGPPPDTGLVAEGQTIELGGTVLSVGADPEAVTRRPPELAEVVLDQPQPPTRGRRRWLAWTIPLLAGAAVAWVAHSLLFLLFALTSPLLAVSGAAGDGRGRRRRDHHRRAAEFAVRVEQALAEEIGHRRAQFPPPGVVRAVATGGSARLWDRPRDGELVVRVGVGPQPARARVRDGAAERPAGTLSGVPLCVPVAGLALTGPGCDGLARWVVVQLAVNHSPADLALTLLVDDPQSPAWSWARWLPHLRGVAGTAATLRSALDEAAEAARARSGPRPVVVVTPGCRAEAAVARLAAAGVAVVWAGGQEPPAWCTTVVRCGAGPDGRLLVSGCGPRSAPASHGTADAVAEPVAEDVARALAGHARPAPAAAPASAGAELVDLLGLRPLDATRVTAAWRASDARPRTILGSGDDGAVSVDLAADGPHALVAGTTGAGKSRLLQTLVTGLAALHPPEEISFLLVDYKGGAAFAECVRLPHVAGLVTDLDPALTRRALRSLEAEVRRRERLLGAARVDTFTAYPRVAAPDRALARLVIVVDEFSTLAEELPDFVRGLVSVARRGRSLGLHLVLATQRPGTAVSAEIRANTDLRIALRVTGTAESVDILDRPDAAALPRSAPGRALLRRDGGVLGFRTALPRSKEPGAVSVTPLGPWREPLLDSSGTDRGGPGGLAVLVDTVAAAARATGRPRARSPWQPPLPRAIAPGALPVVPPPGVAVGLLDRPDDQVQPPLTVEPGGGGSLLLIGAPRSGRSTALAVLGLAGAAAIPPSRLPLYAVDAAGGALAGEIAELPHTAACLARADHGDVVALLRRLEPSHRGLVLVDGLDALLTVDESGELSRELDRLLRGGGGATLTVVAAGGRHLLGARAAAGFEQRWLLRLTDRSDYGLAGVPTDAIPDDPPAGRGVRAGDGTEFQLAVPDPPLRADARAQPGNLPAGVVRLRPLPACVTLAELPRDRERITLGVAGDEAVPVQLAPFAPEAVRLLVTGPAGSGRSTVLATLGAEGQRLGLRVVVAAPPGSPLGDPDAPAAQRPLVLRPGDDPGDPPPAGALLLVDDAEAFAATRSEDPLCRWLAAPGVAAVVAVCTDDPASPHRGLAGRARSQRRGVLLRPAPMDGHLLGVQLPGTGRPHPGRGVIVGIGGVGGVDPAGHPAPDGSVRVFQAARPC